LPALMVLLLKNFSKSYYLIINYFIKCFAGLW
jgi:hypothetical protein